MTTVLQPAEDVTRFAVAGFLARYREPTLSAYRRDRRCFWTWCLGTKPAAAVGAAAARRAVPAGAGATRLPPGDGQPATVDGCRAVQVRRPRRPRPGEPDARRPAAAGAVGRAAPHRAAPAGVRRRLDRHPTGWRHRARPRSTARNAQPTSQRSLHSLDRRPAVLGRLRAPPGRRQRQQVSRIPLPIPVLRARKAVTDGRPAGRSCCPTAAGRWAEAQPPDF